jgi:hypothetical protein
MKIIELHHPHLLQVSYYRSSKDAASPSSLLILNLRMPLEDNLNLDNYIRERGKHELTENKDVKCIHLCVHTSSWVAYTLPLRLSEARVHAMRNRYSSTRET